MGADPKADAVPAPGSGPPVTRRGDVWALGRHRLICGDARVASDYDAPGSRARIGLMGPTRMDYPSNLAAVRAVARYLTRLLDEDDTRR